jgi:phage baseplate assembly protein W
MSIVDILLDDNGDFQVTETGDIKVIEGESAVNESLYRRIKTPATGYMRWVRYVDGLKLLDKEYGNSLFSYLSSPITNKTAERMREGITNAIAGDKRIEVKKLSIQPKENQTKIDIHVEYIIKGENEIRNLEYTLTTET